MNEDVAAFVLARIQKKSKLPADVAVDEFDYVESGHVDSIGIIRFVLDLEREFDIEINEADIVSAGFRTVGGLIDLIAAKCAVRQRESAQ
jgi:acyl carrier protein